MDDDFERLLDLYTKGDLSALVSFLLPKPDSSYDALKSSNPLLPYLVNYFDACLYGSYYDRLHCASYIKQEMLLKTGPHSLASLQRLELEFTFALTKINSKSKFPLPLFLQEVLKENSQTHPSAPPSFIPWIESMDRFCTNRRLFKNANRYFDALVNALPSPFYPLNRELLIDHKLVFDGSPALWIFNDLNHLSQSLQFSDLLEAITNSQSRIYILDQYPHPQLLDQGAFTGLPKRFVSPHHLLHHASTLLSEAIDAVTAQSPETMVNDTEVADWLYHTSKRVLFMMREQQLGKTRTPALIELTNSLKWFDTHKGLPNPNRNLGSIPFDYFKSTLDELSKFRPQFKKRIRLTHVTPQIVDGKHAPSRLLENLILHRNRDQFDVDVIVTERTSHRIKDYPSTPYTATSSKDRGKELIQTFAANHVKVNVLNPGQSFLETAQTVAKELSANNSEIVIFHSPDVINCMATVLAPCPLRVMFEHGTPLTYPGFDLMIASSNDAIHLYGEKFAAFNTRIVALPFHIDVTKTWPKEPPTLNELGIPEGSLVMTTISNHLAARLNNQVCTAITQILKRIPHAFYAPMGDVPEQRKSELLQFFIDQGVSERVRFLGSQSNPGHLSRCMKLYLNEFPFGSCIGMMEAMASGCVPISMYDALGPSQSRYGGDFMGLDHVISSNQIEEYIDLACELLRNPEKYQEWSEYTKKQYMKLSNEKEYVSNFENIIIRNN